MAGRSVQKNRKNNDSQLEFFKLTFSGYERTAPDSSQSGGVEKCSVDPVHPASDHDAVKSSDDIAADLTGALIARPLPSQTENEAETPTAVSYLEAEPKRNQRNYRIAADTKLGAGPPKSKCKNNLAAIQTLKQVESESRPATDQEKRILVNYVGWGGLPQVFDEANEAWEEERQKLRELVTETEWESARATTLNAHYTSPVVIHAMYSALHHFGFGGGNILEPACGIGHFIGCLPEEMHSKSQLTAIEIDSISARITKSLYPDADVRHQPFEESKLVENFYDVAISNIPFGDYRPFDPRFKHWKFSIHDYFFAAALENVRPGGMIVFITSKGTFDKVDTALREYVSQKAELLGAIRLPNDTFKKNANTEVTTDIVMLRKLKPGELPCGPAWRTVAQFTNPQGETIPLNEYFVARPEMMLGEMRLEGRMYQRGEPTLVANGRDLGEQLSEAMLRLPKNVYQSERSKKSSPLSPYSQFIPVPEDVKPNAYALVNGELAVREGDTMRVITDLPATTMQRIRGMVRVRNAVRRCLRSQLESTDESQVVSAREQLNQTYDSFQAKFGPISEHSNASAFRSDPDLPLLLSLERYDPETRRAAKAAIFRERTIQKGSIRRDVSSPKDALLVTLNARGSVDLEFLSNLLHKVPSSFLPELKGAVFLNPQTGEWETDDAYLSGNVRAKLLAAEAAVMVDPKFAFNVEALQGVLPTDLLASEIDARLGSTWVAADDIKIFAVSLIGETDIKVSHITQLGLWQVRSGWSSKISVANTTEWGTDRRSALELLEDALNLRTPTIYDRDSDDHEVVNVTATEAVRDKQQKIKDRFREWIWQDDERRERLVRKYNDEFNNIRLRTFNGDHLTLPGASRNISLDPHQKSAVWRILQTNNCLLAHVVGAGKTFTMVSATMELKRLGFARKPLFTVPNHMLGQFASELLTLYPAANILVATKDDFEKSRRQILMSRIATGNWDAVIVTHSGFEKIPVSLASQQEFFNEQVRELTLAIEQQRQGENSRIVKILERAKKRLETRLKELLSDERKDDGLTFEELGVDRLFVDEAHYFKNLFYVSKMTRIAGLPQTASQRAMDMFLKVSHIQRINGGGGVVFATGTPIANSVAEMFTMQRYLQMAALKSLHVDHFDSWAATFGEPVTSMELAPDGSGYRLNTRFARFINVPELMQQFRQVADIQTQSMLKLRIPELRGGKPSVASAPCSKELKIIVESLVERADKLRTGLVDPREDNMLVVTTDGRKAALDLRLFDSQLPDLPSSKTNLAVTNIERILRETTEQCSAQLIFCDLSTPTNGKGFSVYEDMHDKLIALGIPASEIAFIQDYDTDAAKVALFRDVRAGKVRILFGSTQKMGAGTNVQERLIALHHLDAPWRPADVEQREGRILRQGNRNPEVQIYRYVTESSFDAYMWQTLETKAKFISQVMTGESNARRIEDVDSTALTYAEVKAIASGNPMVIEKANVDAEVARLSRLNMQYHETQFRLRQKLRHSNDDLPRLERKLQGTKEDLSVRQDTRGDKFVIQLGGQWIRDRGIAGELINREAARIAANASEREIGSFAGFKVLVSNSFINQSHALLRGSETHQANISDSAHGTMRSIEYTAENLKEVVLHLEQEILNLQKRSTDLAEQLGQPFEYASRLGELRKRQQEIADSLDLTKNQAPDQFASDAGVDTAIASEQGAVCLGEMGFPEYDD